MQRGSAFGCVPQPAAGLAPAVVRVIRVYIEAAALRRYEILFLFAVPETGFRGTNVPP
jgi:hypothetical protein